MSVATPALPSISGDEAAVPEELIRRLTVEQYHAMIRNGILTDDDPVELLEGWLVQKMPKKPPHRAATGLTRRALERVIPEDWHLDSQEPVTTDESEPEPAVSVVRGTLRDYADRHPGPHDVGLLVEVADVTLPRDRTLKKRIYARANVHVYWIVNLPESKVEVYTVPSGPAAQPDYAERRDYGPDNEIPVVLDGIEVGRMPVRDLLP